MMPIPTHLIDCVLPKDAAIDEAPLYATVRCPCGSTGFDLLFPGQTQEFRGVPIPCVANIDGNFFFLVEARCANCTREHLLLDKDFHGWNGFVCHDSEQASIPRPPLVLWKCLACGGNVHQAEVQIQSEGKDDFRAETNGELDEERWPDGFSWFSMAITCIGCGKQTPEWISYETM